MQFDISVVPSANPYDLQISEKYAVRISGVVLLNQAGLPIRPMEPSELAQAETKDKALPSNKTADIRVCIARFSPAQIMKTDC